MHEPNIKQNQMSWPKIDGKIHSYVFFFFFFGTPFILNDLDPKAVFLGASHGYSITSRRI